MTSAVSMPAGHAMVGSDFDAYENLTGAWSSYTPVWTSSGTAPAIGNGSVVGKYIQVGKLVIVHAHIVFGSTSTFGTGTYTFSVPVTALTTTPYIGSFLCDDNSVTANRTGGSCVLDSTTKVAFYSTGGIVTSLVPFTWAQSDQIRFSIMYEAA